MAPPSRPFWTALILVVALLVAVLTSSGQGLDFRDGDLVLVRHSWWGARKQVVGVIDGRSGYWWITKPGGQPQPYIMPSGEWSRAPSP